MALSRSSPEKEKLPSVICADRFYITEHAMKLLESEGKVIWADSESEDEFIKKVRDANAKVIISEYVKITDRVLDASPALKGVVVWGVGYDHIDVEAASERGIYVANTRGSNMESVAEHVFALMVSLSRQLLQGDAFIRRGGWVAREEAKMPRELIGHDLYERTLGIIGLGAIGSRVSTLAHCWDMRVIASDPQVSIETAKRLEVELVDLEKLLRESDFVTLHVILTEETKGMISTKELNLMKPTAYLINTSRGPVIDEEALIQALRKKKIAGAGLDVFSKEPIDLGNPLLKFDNVVLTPHCAGCSEDALKATSLMCSQEAVRILQGETPKNLVNRMQLLKRGYLS